MSRQARSLIHNGSAGSAAPGTGRLPDSNIVGTTGGPHGMQPAEQTAHRARNTRTAYTLSAAMTLTPSWGSRGRRFGTGGEQTIGCGQPTEVVGPFARPSGASCLDHQGVTTRAGNREDSQSLADTHRWPPIPHLAARHGAPDLCEQEQCRHTRPAPIDAPKLQRLWEDSQVKASFGMDVKPSAQLMGTTPEPARFAWCLV
jgi:hypothetical protein